MSELLFPDMTHTVTHDLDAGLTTIALVMPCDKFLTARREVSCEDLDLAGFAAAGLEETCRAIIARRKGRDITGDTPAR